MTTDCHPEETTHSAGATQVVDEGSDLIAAKILRFAQDDTGLLASGTSDGRIADPDNLPALRAMGRSHGGSRDITDETLAAQAISQLRIPTIVGTPPRGRCWNLRHRSTTQYKTAGRLVERMSLRLRTYDPRPDCVGSGALNPARALRASAGRQLS